MQQVVARLDESKSATNSPEMAGLSAGEDNTSSQYRSCVATTRRAANGGQYGPGIVATAKYQGHATLVMEFWPTISPPPAGKAVVAVSTTDTCRLVGRTTK